MRFRRIRVASRTHQLHAGHATVQPLGWFQQRRQLFRVYPRRGISHPDDAAGRSEQEDLVHRIRLLLESDTTSWLRILLVIDRAEAGELSGPGVHDGTRAGLCRGTDAVEPQLSGGGPTNQ